MNLIIPLAGKDKNFEDKGLCKPLVEIEGKPAIKWIADSRPFDYRKGIFILLREHQLKFQLDSKLKELFGDNIKIIWVEEPTGGAPQSVLLAKELINNDEELIIDLPDQYIDFYGLMDFLKEQKKYDGIIPTFKSSYWNRGYMIIDKEGFVKKVSEKDKIPISNDSTACVSYFKHGKDFVWAAEEMIKKDRRAANGGFLISLAYNELIEKGMKIGTYPVEFISTLGTIEGVSAFLQHLRPLKKSKVMKNKIILHRGYKGKFPENSRISFYYAIKENLPFETDIRISKDGEVYLIHDDSLDRLFNGIGRINEKDSQELTKYRYKGYSSQGLCSLKEMCGLIKQMNYKNLIFIHIKELNDIGKVIQVLESYDYNFKDIVRFFSVDDMTLDLIRIIKSNYPSYQVGLHFNDNSKIDEGDFQLADFIWADEINKENITKELVDFSHRLNKPIYAISPELIEESKFNKDIKKRWKELLDLSVDGICTDMPEEFLEFDN